MNRINAAYNNGPDLLNPDHRAGLHIPINHYVSVDFPVSGHGRRPGGVDLNFPTAIRDSYTGLDSPAGCQAVTGSPPSSWSGPAISST